jgi:hypothetical protein
MAIHSVTFTQMLDIFPLYSYHSMTEFCSALAKAEWELLTKFKVRKKV